MTSHPLPSWPMRGKRRRLDELWLERLEEQGWQTLLAYLPGAAPPELQKALEEFNDGLFWQCHETLEGLWLRTPYPLRLLYHGMIKIAAGFHHLSRHNAKGAASKLSEGLRLLSPFTPSFWGMDTGRLWRETEEWLRMLRGAGARDWQVLDGRSRPKIHVLYGDR